MKKSIVGIIMMAGLLLLASCGPDTGAEPTKTPESGNTPTPTVGSTCTPTAGPTPELSEVPTVTEAVEPTVIPGPTSTTAPAATLAPSSEPTATPTVTVTLSPTPTVTVTPSPTPVATSVPSPEPTAVPTVTVAPSPAPTPSIDPESLINSGWQKTISIDEEYCIIFPDLFRESTVAKTDRVLQVGYTCAEDSGIGFLISYTMQQTLEDTVNEIPETEGIVFEGSLEEKRVTCCWQKANMVYRSILVEGQYPGTLLGKNFGEEEWITGVMQVVFSYPAERCEEYETTKYHYFVIANGEE